jgi:CBS domain-containing protein
MHPGLLTCQADTSLGQVAILLARHKVHALVVAEPSGQPVGIISDFDLLAGEWLSVDNESLRSIPSKAMCLRWRRHES